MQSIVRAQITGMGVYKPERILSNLELEKKVDTSDTWIRDRTGIQERRILDENSGMSSSKMGAEAAREALLEANLKAEDLDAIICGTINPDKAFPSTACLIQKEIGATRAMAFDIVAACASWVYGTNMAALLIQAGQCQNVLVIGAEHLSGIVDWSDRNTCILFGDAAGATVFSATTKPAVGVLRSFLQSDGRESEILYMDHKERFIKMDGQRVFKVAVRELAANIEKALALEGLSAEDIHLLVPHQANKRILNSMAERLGLNAEKVFINLPLYGNTSSASIPLALYEAKREGKLKPGHLVVTAGIGAGMAWGCNLIRI